MSPEDEETRLTHEVALRAIRRLDILEWVTLSGAAMLAVGGGALLALLLEEMVPWSFRTIWIVAALLFFLVPGAVALTRLRREEAEARRRLNQRNDESHG